MLRCLTICCVTAVFTVLHCKDVFALLIMSLVQPNKKEYNRILHSAQKRLNRIQKRVTFFPSLQ